MLGRSPRSTMYCFIRSRETSTLLVLDMGILLGLGKAKGHPSPVGEHHRDRARCRQLTTHRSPRHPDACQAPLPPSCRASGFVQSAISALPQRRIRCSCVSKNGTCPPYAPGTSTAGGTRASGGTSNTGGSRATGGSGPTGGAVSNTGGLASTGGSKPSGGSTSIASNTGGTTGIVTAVGGRASMGGSSNTAGGIPSSTGGATSTNPGSIVAGSSGTGGTGGASTQLFTGGTPSSAGTGEPTNSNGTSDFGGCGCRVGVGHSRPALAILWGIFGFAMVRRLRRTR